MAYNIGDCSTIVPFFMNAHERFYYQNYNFYDIRLKYKLFYLSLQSDITKVMKLNILARDDTDTTDY